MKAGLVIAALGDLGWEQVASGWNGAGRFGIAGLSFVPRRYAGIERDDQRAGLGQL